MKSGNLTNGYGAGTTELHIFRKITDDIFPEYIHLYFQLEIYYIHYVEEIYIGCV